MTVSIIIPVVRPDKAERCVKALVDQNLGCEIVTEYDTNRIGCPKMVDRLVEKATGDLIVFLGDDTIPHPGWLDAGLKAMSSLPDGWGVVGLKTQGNPPADHAHWMADRRMLPLLGGQFFSTEYQHCYCDNELEEIAREHGRWGVTDAVVIEHDHPINGGEEDEHYVRAYMNGAMGADRKLYIRRKRARLNKLAIGFPLVDQNIPVQFFSSFVCMQKPSEYIFLLPQFPHGPWTGSVADARNSLVEQAQLEGAAWLLMCDTDQVYPPDTLTRLLAHNKDVCGVRVHRRYPPFDPIFYRGKVGEYLNVSDEEAYSGDLIEVDATGTGCLLFNMELFDHIDHPWFEFTMHNGRAVGEDINFCSKVRGIGRHIFVDTSIEVGHLTTMQIGRQLHQLYCKLRRQEHG